MNLFFEIPCTHDAAICFLKNSKMHYLKLERFLQIKHIGNIHPNFEFYQHTMMKYLGNDWQIVNKSNMQHHLRHACSVDFFEDTACDVHVVIDGEGDQKWFSIYRQNQLIDCAYIMNTGGSLGHGLAASASNVGITNCHNLDKPGKTMGLQSFGKLHEKWYEKLQKYNMTYLGEYYSTSLNSFIQNKDHLFAIPADVDYEEKINILHTIHKRAGEIVLAIFQKFVKPHEKVGYSGGVAQNIVWNTMLKKHYPNLVIYPHSSDEGQVIGLLEWFRQQNSLPKSLFRFTNFPFSQFDQLPPTTVSNDVIFKTAQHLASGKTVAWYQGHGEIGPRALGNRSILMDPRIANGKEIINTIKNREYYRPFGASVLSEFADEYFALNYPNPYMLYLGITQKDNLQSITHVDGTSRVQTVDKSLGSFRTLLEMFYELTGCPVLLNTSLNEAGKPIAGYIKNADNVYKNSALAILVVGNDIYEK